MKRVDGELAVSRALGDFQYKSEELDPRMTKVLGLLWCKTGAAGEALAFCLPTRALSRCQGDRKPGGDRV